MKKRLPYRLIAIAALLLLGVAAAVSILPVDGWPDQLEARMERLSLFEGLLLFVAAYVVATLLLLPAWIFAVAAGATFGFAWGALVSMVSSVLSGSAAFLIARYLLRRRIERIASRYDALKAVDRAVGRRAWKVVALLRLSPIMPASAKSYFLGVTRVGLYDFASATAVGTLPGTLLKVYIGAAGADVFKDGSPLDWALLVGGIVATVAMTFIIARLARREFKRPSAA